MKRFLLDSNIIIYHLSDVPEVHRFLASANAQTDKMFYSFISRIELLGYPDITSKEKEKIRKLFDTFSKVSMNDEIEEIVITIRKEKNIRIPEAIIAASAIHTRSTLVTRNEKDFRNIPRLKILNPFTEFRGVAANR